MTLEDISLKKQRVAGIDNAENTLSIRALKSINEVPAVSVKGSNGFVILTDSLLTGGTKARKNGVAVLSAVIWGCTKIADINYKSVARGV